MHDLQDLWLMVNESTIFEAALLKAAQSLGDQDLEKDIQKIEKEMSINVIGYLAI